MQIFLSEVNHLVLIVRIKSVLCLFWYLVFSSSMDELYTLFFENLSDGIPSVRQGAAISLGNVVKAYGRYIHGF